MPSRKRDPFAWLDKRIETETELKRALLERKLRRLGIRAEPKPRTARPSATPIDAPPGLFLNR